MANSFWLGVVSGSFATITSIIVYKYILLPIVAKILKWTKRNKRKIKNFFIVTISFIVLIAILFFVFYDVIANRITDI